MTIEVEDFTDFQLGRYSRQIRLEGFGLAAQRRLRESHVAISRGGGVGGTIALHLARAGIGRLTIAHGGTLVPEYLNRMPLIFTGDIGRPCVEAFADTLAKVNPDVSVQVVGSYVTDDNVEEIVGDADLIADGAPLFEERYALNRAAVARRLPLVSGAMYDTEGFVTTVRPGSGPCLACIFPVRPDYWTDIGVFPAIGPGPTIVGAMAAMEVIKVLTGFGEPLDSRMWFFDLRTNMTQTLKVGRDPDCTVCAHLGTPG
ncbi:HesA/MoeB/ThiF family protein [Spirillospora sp. NPDC047279]|uniref:HesA/MoeB/ThiF family protein n=1 Tax=Spirillospora sp. NPDC047279 TaxID=3155478 RepID=UPI0033E7D964